MSSDLVEIGQMAVAFVKARSLRMAARRERNQAAFDFGDEDDAPRYSEHSDHPRGYSDAFLSATASQQAAYETALRNEKSARQKLYASVKKHVRGAA